MAITGKIMNFCPSAPKPLKPEVGNKSMFTATTRISSNAHQNSGIEITMTVYLIPLSHRITYTVTVILRV